MLLLDGKITPMHASWIDRLLSEFNEPYMKQLEAYLTDEKRLGYTVYPPSNLIFNALCQTPFEGIRVVIIGQDPYHGPGQAHGLSFSVPDEVRPPPSLVNIFKEIQSDLGIPVSKSGNLLSWAKQGVLLLNATFSVREGKPKSHFGQGWERFTDHIVELLWERPDPIVFLLWGKSAAEKVPQGITHHLVLKAPHPSPLSAYAGFLGCRHFSKTNAFLVQKGKQPIDWAVH
jgi:uracil-DNA glycosylase